MEKMVNVYFFGKKYEVPASLTIMKAMEYAGYQLVRGCGCRNGFCGACATLYRIKGKTELKTMQYIAYAQRGEYAKCAEESFDCIMCGLCSSRCPAGISHPQVAILARRLYGKYIAPECKHLLDRVAEINEGKHDDSMADIMNKSLEEQKALYNSRDIEK